MAARERHLLPQPAETVVRHLARQLLEEAQGAASRLDADDPEALHDFRVAVRRLRTLLRAYDELALVPKKRVRRLRDLAHATNESRDLTVALENLRARAQATDPVAATLVERLSRRHDAVHADTIEELSTQWPPLSARLHRALGAEPTGSGPAFREAASQRITVEWTRLQRRLDALRAQWDDKAAHRARLAGKRLRYLFEPLTAEIPEAKEAVSALKVFQDRFGLYHDLWVLLGMIAELAAESAAVATHARVRHGSAATVHEEQYLPLANALREERRRLAEALKGDYLAPPFDPLRPVAEAIRAIAAR